MLRETEPPSPATSADETLLAINSYPYLTGIGPSLAIHAGWRHLPAVPVDIPATYALKRRGVWYLVERGIRGLLVPAERGAAVVFMVCEPASHYYRIMTGSERMPVFIEQRI
jgi:hypothetical protein